MYSLIVVRFVLACCMITHPTRQTVTKEVDVPITFSCTHFRYVMKLKSHLKFGDHFITPNPSPAERMGYLQGGTETNINQIELLHNKYMRYEAFRKTKEGKRFGLLSLSGKRSALYSFGIQTAPLYIRDTPQGKRRVGYTSWIIVFHVFTPLSDGTVFYLTGTTDHVSGEPYPKQRLLVNETKRKLKLEIAKLLEHFSVSVKNNKHLK